MPASRIRKRKRKHKHLWSDTPHIINNGKTVIIDSQSALDRLISGRTGTVEIENLELRYSCVHMAFKNIERLTFKNCLFNPPFSSPLSIEGKLDVVFDDCTFLNVSFHFEDPEVQISIINPRGSKLSIEGTSAYDRCNAFCSGMSQLHDFSVGKFRSVRIENGMATGTEINYTYYVEILNTTEDKPKAVTLSVVTNLELRDVHIKKLNMTTFCSCIISLSLTSSEVNIFTVNECTVRNFNIRCSTIISALYACSAVCRDHSVKESDFALFSANSSGFPDGVNLTIYKKVAMYRFGVFLKHVVLELSVPAIAMKRISLSSRKIRVSEAIPVKLYDTEMNPIKKPWFAKLLAMRDRKYEYRLGKVAKPLRKFDESTDECSSGIHGFIDPDDAKEYLL